MITEHTRQGLSYGEKERRQQGRRFHCPPWDPWDPDGGSNTSLDPITSLSQ